MIPPSSLSTATTARRQIDSPSDDGHDRVADDCTLDSGSDSDVQEDSAASSHASHEVLHDLEIGDHVIRWKLLAVIYPIQIHGIVLSAGPDIVTIVDFGLTSYRSKQREEEQERPGIGGDAEPVGEVDDDDCEDDPSVMAEWKKRRGKRRLNVLTLTDKKEIRKWKKVNYGESMLTSGKLSKLTAWWRKDSSISESGGNASQHDGDCFTSSKPSSFLDSKPKEQSEGEPSTEVASKTLEPKENMNPLRGKSQEPIDNEGQSSEVAEVPSGCGSKLWWRDQPKIGSEALDERPNETLSSVVERPAANNDSARQQQKLPKSDPTTLVLARVRFLLEHETGDHSSSILPPYHLLYSNSECIAVWCKTGSWSTLQAAVFLHSTAAGNAKSAATLALYVSAQTVTVPATGWAGFWGGTVTVSLLSTQPWLIPALAGYGLVAVGAPYVVLHRCKGKWEAATRLLTDAFWSWAPSEVYVEVIRQWSGLR